jgi:hypothetical protein
MVEQRHRLSSAYDFLRPTIAEIVAEYKRMHGTNPPPEEADPEADPEEGEEEGESDRE